MAIQAPQRREKTNLFDNLNLPIEPCSPTLDKRNISSQTHPIDMSPRIQIIEGVEHNVESLEPFDVKVQILDVCMVGLQLNVWIEFPSGFLRDLSFTVSP